jgi:L-2-hydroxyglutarate oxidase LhgO
MVDIARAEGAEPQDREVDVVLVGAGIMSATLGVTLTELQPDLRIEMFEVLEKEAQESSRRRSDRRLPSGPM